MPTNIGECITAVSQSNGLAQTECHASAKLVGRVLSGREMGKCESGTLKSLASEIGAAAADGRNVVYRIDLPGVGHSFALAQCGTKMALFQSWEGCYTLQEWLLGTKEEIKKNPFLPRNGEFGHEVITLYLGTLSADLLRRESGKALEYVKAIFNPTGARVSVARMALTLQGGRALDTLWDSEAIL